MSIKEIKTLLGTDYEVQTRSNGLISIGVATEKLSTTNDVQKFEMMKTAYDKLSEAGTITSEFGEVFKSGNPPIQGSKLVGPDGRESKAPWRVYFHLLFAPEAQAAARPDPGPEYLKVLLAAGVPAQEAMNLIRSGKVPETKPETSATPEGVVNGDEDIPV